MVSLTATARVVDMPVEWQGRIPTRVFIDEAMRILKAASEAQAPLKMLGGLAIKVHSLNEEDFARRLGRAAAVGQEYSDIDFGTYYRTREAVRRVLESFGYSKRPTTMSTSAAQRQIYFHPRGWFYIDVFWDKLKAANHPIDFRGRLEIDPVSIPLADLLLEKIQIVHFSKKDLIDSLILLKAHVVSEKEERDTISTERIAHALARDWGFWYTATTNLRGLKEHLKRISGPSEAEVEELSSKIDLILSAIDSASKSMGWRLRSVLGTKKKWYNPVETEETVGEFGIWRLREDPKPAI